MDSGFMFLPRREKMKDKRMHYTILAVVLFACGFAQAATQVVEGESWSGAKYRLSVPDNWNGDLVVYAHGYIDAAEPIALPTTVDEVDALRDLWTSKGYAVAYSSYSKNGFAVQEGTVDTLCLNWYFKKAFGKPERTFLVGHSLGGLVCVRLAECLPNHYDGVLTVAGMIGGSQVEIDYMANVRILFEMNYPGVLPSAIDEVPPGLDFMADVVYPVIGALSANPTNAVAMSMIDQTPLPWTTGEELVGSYVYALGFWYRGFADMVDRTGSEAFFGNEATVYTSSYLPPDILDPLNQYAPRFASSRSADRYFRWNYESTGKLRVPMLGIHNSRDPVVPQFHQAIYADKVAQRKCGKNLVQRQIDRHGHTEKFSAEEVFGAFEELVEWADTGIKPTP
jgi:pimeloyl-ACP methyl ester carboxylesterase